MTVSNKQPQSPVEKGRAMQHALFAMRRAWAGDVPDFEGAGRFELDPDPLVIYDLNGQELFYEFRVMEGDEQIGAVKASASKTLGSAVPEIELGQNHWQASHATWEARKRAKELFPNAEILDSELVCYCYPKIGVRVDLSDANLGGRSVIFDVSDFSLVDRFGSDEVEGLTSYSLYQEFAQPMATLREQQWEMADQEMEASGGSMPNMLEGRISDVDQPNVKARLIPQATATSKLILPFYSSKVLKFSPRCKTHDCFELYAQKTNVYCAVATGQMILDFYRYHYTQAEIAKAMGTGGGGTSNTGQVKGYESLSHNCLEATYDSSATWSEAKAEIDANRPVKSGIPGHARACAGWMRQNIFIVGQKPKLWLRIYDPWPWNSNICEGGRIVWEDWDAITHTNFIYVRHRTKPCS